MADIRKREGEKGTTWQLRFNDPNSGEVCRRRRTMMTLITAARAVTIGAISETVSMYSRG